MSEIERRWEKEPKLKRLAKCSICGITTDFYRVFEGITPIRRVKLREPVPFIVLCASCETKYKVYKY